MPDIVLTTLNARFSHASLGLRYLYANLGEWQPRAVIREFIIKQHVADIVESLLQDEPRIIGLGVYIWNIEESTRVVALLKQLRPDIKVVLGGPEVSYEWQEQRIVALADYLITGPGDISFARLCGDLLSGRKPLNKVIAGEQPRLAELQLPYAYYTDADLAHRLIYVEASRGCPFKCEFCLSSLDKTAWAFPLEPFLAEMDRLYQRGARTFKFVDRTFNLNIATSRKILAFFLQRLDERLFVHFEVIPDHLPDGLKEDIRRFPPGVLQLEVGIQTFNPAVQALISRKQDNERSEENLRWLRQESAAHLHTDLIIGLPSEDLASFAAGFDRLARLQPHEIQVGILKRLRGTPIIRHTADYDMRYNPEPPYNILANDQLDFATLQRLTRFARYWDLVANTGRFAQVLPVLLGEQPFARFLQFSDWLWQSCGQTHQIAIERLFELVYRGLGEVFAVPDAMRQSLLLADWQAAGLRNRPRFLPLPEDVRAARKAARQLAEST